MEEIWKVCFEDYEISNFGNCRRKLKTGDYNNVKGYIYNRGYKCIQLKRDGKRITKLFHHLVAEQFIGPRPEGLIVDHIDRNKLNNNVSNLRYVTYTENNRNTVKYRDDITETDITKRNLIIKKKNYQKNKEKRLQYQREYYEKNIEKISQQRKELYQKKKLEKELASTC